MVKDSRILDVRVLKLYRTRIGAASTLEPLHPRLQKALLITASEASSKGGRVFQS